LQIFTTGTIAALKTTAMLIPWYRKEKPASSAMKNVIPTSGRKHGAMDAYRRFTALD